MPRPSVISIGKFDGVHRGHREILATARELAQERDARVMVLTFDPHPSTTLDPSGHPPRLCSRRQKIERLKQIGADEVAVLAPTPAVLGLAPAEFIRQVVHEHRPCAFVEGADFRFGKARAGDMTLMTRLGAECGFDVIIQPYVDVTLSDLSIVTVHSTIIRWLVGHGRVGDAQRCLGEPFSLVSTVVQGEQRGRTIGFPTLNLDLNPLADHMIPADGVYAGVATWPGADRPYTAAISVGPKPTFGQLQLTVEAHLLDFTGDLYGRNITLAFTRWVRDQMRFPSAEALRRQLARDMERVRHATEDMALTT